MLSFQALKSDLESRLKTALEEKVAIEKKLSAAAQAEKDKQKKEEEEEQQKQKSGGGNSIVSEMAIKAQVESLKSSLSVATQQLDSMKKVEAESRAEAQRQIGLATEAQTR